MLFDFWGLRPGTLEELEGLFFILSTEEQSLVELEGGQPFELYDQLPKAFRCLFFFLLLLFLWKELFFTDLGQAGHCLEYVQSAIQYILLGLQKRYGSLEVLFKFLLRLERYFVFLERKLFLRCSWINADAWASMGKHSLCDLMPA